MSTTKKYYNLDIFIEIDCETIEVAVSEFTIVQPCVWADNPDDFFGYQEAEFTFKNGKHSEDYDVDCSDIHDLVVAACNKEVGYHV